MPALPLHTAGKYVAAAYLVVFAILLIYVSIMAVRLARVERELGELVPLARERRQPAAGESLPGESLQRPAADEVALDASALEAEPAHP